MSSPNQWKRVRPGLYLNKRTGYTVERTLHDDWDSHRPDGTSIGPVVSLQAAKKQADAEHAARVKQKAHAPHGGGMKYHLALLRDPKTGMLQAFDFDTREDAIRFAKRFSRDHEAMVCRTDVYLHVDPDEDKESK